MTPIDFFRAAVGRYPHADAVIEVDHDGRILHQLSYTALAHDVQAAASMFQSMSGQKRPRVAIASHNSTAMLVCILAVYQCRGILIPLHVKTPENELRRQIAVAQPDILVTDNTVQGLAAGQTLPSMTIRRGADGAPQFSPPMMPGQLPVIEETDGDDIIAMKFTGGTSGAPKVVLQSARCLNTMVISLLHVYAFAEQDRFLINPPMTHGAGTFVLPVLAAGGCLVIMDGAKAGALLNALTEHKISGTWMPPTLLYQVLDQQALQPRDLPCLRNLLYGGAGATLERLRQARGLLGPVVGVTYGLTEAPVILAGMSGKDGALDANLGSAGRAGPLTRLAVMRQDGQLCAAHEVGEIVARGDLLMQGYLDMPEQTGAALSGGWLHTGDLGYLDERGYLFIKGRLKEIIISGGFNVYPADIENALAKHADVAESVAFGIPDPHWGERVEAVVELKRGRESPPQMLRDHVYAQLGAIRTPKSIHLVDTLSRNALGKIQKRQLRELFTREFSRARPDSIVTTVTTVTTVATVATGGNSHGYGKNN